MSELKAEMAFEIGDVVYFAGPLPAGKQPVPWIVIERFVQECHGGIQRNYMLAGDSAGRVHPEIALTKARPMAKWIDRKTYEEIKSRMESDEIVDGPLGVEGVQDDDVEIKRLRSEVKRLQKLLTKPDEQRNSCGWGGQPLQSGRIS